MKKLLALVLALVMTLSLCTITNAADFTDKADVDYTEAVDVMKAVGVLAGYEDGSFQPDKAVTRAEAAKIIAYLDLGQKTADALVKDVTPFKDVAAGNWATGYITYCYNAGIISGMGGGTFAPDAQVTALQFAKMLLCVLGYKADAEGLNGADWALNTAKLASKNDLFKGNDAIAVTAAATRQEVAQYAFNALKAQCVQYAVGTTTVKGEGIEVTVGGSAAAPYTNATYGGKISDESTANYVQLGEKLYKGDLKLNGNAGKDNMGRPANVWTWKNIEIASAYADAADYTFVVAKTNKTFKELITAVNDNLTYPADEADDIVYINNGSGKDIDNASSDANGPYVGDVVEVYLSGTTANQVAKVIVTRYSSAKVTGAVQTKTTDGVDYVRVPGVINSYTETKYVHGYADLAKNDIVYFYKAATNNNWYLAKAEKVTGTVTAFTAATTSSGAKFNIGGTQYKTNENVGAVTGLCSAFVDNEATGVSITYNTEYDFYLDNNGYVVYGIATEKEKSDYVVLQSIAWVGASGVNNTGYAEARLVKMDGTTEVVKVASIDGYKAIKTGDALNGAGTIKAGTTYTKVSAKAGNDITSLPTTVDVTTDGTAVAATKFYALGTTTTFASADKYVGIGGVAANAALEDKFFFTYTLNSDGDYELTTVTNDTANKQTVGSNTALTVTNKSATITDLCAVNNNTVFVVAKSTNGKTFEVYTGKDAVPSMTAVSAAYVAKDGIATYVYVDAFTGKTTGGDKIFFLSATPSAFNTIKDGTTTYTYNEYKAVVNGEITTVKVKASAIGTVTATGEAVAVGTLVSPTYDKYGVATALGASDLDQAVGYGYNYAGGSLYVADGTTGSYSCTDDTVLFYKDEDGNYTKGTFADYASDDNDAIYVVVKGTDATTVDYAYVQYVDDADLTIASVKYGTTSANTAFTDEEYTSGTKTYAKTGLAESTLYKVAVDVNGLLTVKFSATADGTYTAADDGMTTLTTGAAGTAAVKVYFKIVAVDGTESDVYTVSLTPVTE